MGDSELMEGSREVGSAGNTLLRSMGEGSGKNPKVHLAELP